MKRGERLGEEVRCLLGDAGVLRGEAPLRELADVFAELVEGAGGVVGGDVVRGDRCGDCGHGGVYAAVGAGAADDEVNRVDGERRGDRVEHVVGR